jgi:hypothetical protein
MTFIAPPIAPINPIPPIGPTSLHGAGLLEVSKIKVNQGLLKHFFYCALNMRWQAPTKGKFRPFSSNFDQKLNPKHIFGFPENWGALGLPPRLVHRSCLGEGGSPESLDEGRSNPRSIPNPRIFLRNTLSMNILSLKTHRTQSSPVKVSQSDLT